MQLTDKPVQLTIPFANSGTRSAIPVLSQIGIVAGAASLTDGFPPLTCTPIAAGGVPPSGADMNGILYEMSAADRWANMGGGYPYDSTYATAISGYPKGARVLRTDGAGYWLNTTDSNTTDPEAGGAGWRPDLMPGATPVTMTGSNVTLTALQYGQPVIIVTGVLSADLNLIFPALTGQWTVINATTGAHTITAKTAAGTGVAVSGATAVVGDGTNILAVGATPSDAYKDIPANPQTTSYTLALTDRGKSIDTTAGVTVPPNSSVAFPVGTVVTVSNVSSSAITITQGSGVTLHLAGSATTGNRTLAQYGQCTARKTATDTWLISGAGLS